MGPPFLLLKQTIVSASGNFTPNCRTLGLFDLYQTGVLHIREPENVDDGQLFAIRVRGTGSPFIVTWDAAYVPTADLCGGNFGGINFQDHLFLWNDGHAIFLAGAYV